MVSERVFADIESRLGGPGLVNVKGREPDSRGAWFGGRARLSRRCFTHRTENTRRDPGLRLEYAALTKALRAIVCSRRVFLTLAG